MRIERVKIDEIHVLRIFRKENNRRIKNQEIINPVVIAELDEELRKEFEKFFNEKISKKYVLIDGYNRLKIFKKRGEDEVFARVLKVKSIDDFIKYHVALNPVRNYKDLAFFLFNKGFSKNRLAKIFNVSRRTINIWLKTFELVRESELLLDGKTADLDVKALLEGKIREAKEKEAETVLITINELQAILNYINELEDTSKKLQEELIKARKIIEEHKKLSIEDSSMLEKFGAEIPSTAYEKMVTRKQLKYINLLFSRIDEEYHPYIKKYFELKFGKKDFEKLSSKEASFVIDFLREIEKRPIFLLLETIKIISEKKGIPENEIEEMILKETGFYPDEFFPTNKIFDALKLVWSGI